MHYTFGEKPFAIRSQLSVEFRAIVLNSCRLCWKNAHFLFSTAMCTHTAPAKTVKYSSWYAVKSKTKKFNKIYHLQLMVVVLCAQ